MWAEIFAHLREAINGNALEPFGDEADKNE
jgi:hypothetical protein